jgi:hypothetical protein
VRHSTIVIRESIIRVDPNGSVVVSDGLVVLSLFEVDESSVLVGDADGGVDVYGSRVVIDGLLFVVHGLVANGPVEVAERVVVIELQG